MKHGYDTAIPIMPILISHGKFRLGMIVDID
jgi:hypothetical protein